MNSEGFLEVLQKCVLSQDNLRYQKVGRLVAGHFCDGFFLRRKPTLGYLRRELVIFVSGSLNMSQILGKQILTIS